MAKKLNVTPEMEEMLKKANVPEEAIAKLKETEIDVDKLSLDALDEVSGGDYSWGNETPPEDWPCPPLKNMTLSEGRALINTLYNTLGLDVTVEFCISNFGFHTSAWKESLKAGGPNYCADVIWGICWRNLKK